MSDLISRQAALAELDKAAWGKDWDKALAAAILKSLPSAQQWIPCRNRGKVETMKAYIEGTKADYEVVEDMPYVIVRATYVVDCPVKEIVNNYKFPEQIELERIKRHEAEG